MKTHTIHSRAQADEQDAVAKNAVSISSIASIATIASIVSIASYDRL